MSASTGGSPYIVGFLSVVECPPHGIVGGLLTLNNQARPLEFHCTTPVVANRAQEILYGPSLQPYLYGEQIGGILVRQLKRKPQVICTDSPHTLAVRDCCSQPVVWIHASQRDESSSSLNDKAGEDQLAQAESLATTSNVRPEPLPLPLEPVVNFRFWGQDVSVLQRKSEDQSRIEQGWPEDSLIDLQEAFQRIHTAVREAQKAAA